jgi:hypothetical protein
VIAVEIDGQSEKMITAERWFSYTHTQKQVFNIIQEIVTIQEKRRKNNIKVSVFQEYEWLIYFKKGIN